DPDLEVGTLLNPEIVIDYTSGNEYRHRPPGNEPLAGKLMTTEGVHLDEELSQRFFARGCLGVDMESAALAPVWEEHDCEWSIYRCMGDRYFVGLLDERLIAMAKPDGSGDPEAIQRLLAQEPDLQAKLDQLTRDTTRAAQLAAEAAARGCRALDG